MNHMQTTRIVAASLSLALLLGLAGCFEDDGGRYRGDRDRYPERYERHDNDRQEERHDSDRHEDRGGNPGHEGHEGEHGGR
jgi:hypothetical protein